MTWVNRYCQKNEFTSNIQPEPWVKGLERETLGQDKIVQGKKDTWRNSWKWRENGDLPVHITGFNANMLTYFWMVRTLHSKLFCCMHKCVWLDYRLATQNMHPPGGFLETTFFWKLIHTQVEIRLSAKITTLGEAVRALFVKMASRIQYIA